MLTSNDLLDGHNYNVQLNDNSVIEMMYCDDMGFFVDTDTDVIVYVEDAVSFHTPKPKAYWFSV